MELDFLVFVLWIGVREHVIAICLLVKKNHDLVLLHENVPISLLAFSPVKQVIIHDIVARI